MTKTIATDQISSEDEYNLVATFSEHSLNVLTGIQSKLSEHFDDAIWLKPFRASTNRK